MKDEVHLSTSPYQKPHLVFQLCKPLPYLVASTFTAFDCACTWLLALGNAGTVYIRDEFDEVYGQFALGFLW